MNKDRRDALATLRNQIEAMAGMRDTIRDELDSIKSDEEEYKDNMPESFQNGDKGERAQSAIDAMQEAFDALDAIDFDEITNALDAASE